MTKFNDFDLPSITISGPGGNINYEYYVILKALKEAGLQVIEDNSHPLEDPQSRIDIIKERIDSGYISNKRVRLVANHIPWPG